MDVGATTPFLWAFEGREGPFSFVQLGILFPIMTIGSFRVF